MLHRRAALSLAGGVGLAGTLAAATRPAAAQGAPPAALPRAGRAEDVGLSAERLARIGTWLKAEVEGGRIPGAIALVARGGRIAYLEAVGFRDRDARAPMPEDAIFRIASMTKPMASLALMMLAEEGRVMLWHPVSNYLPEFGDQVVGMERTAVTRPMTLHDILRHASGLTYGGGRHPVQQAYAQANVSRRDQTAAQFITGLSRMPLMYQPGSHWEYSVSTDVVGRVVEVASGMDLDSFIRQRIALPLGMASTGFWAPPEAAERAARAQVDPVTNQRQNIPDVMQRPQWFSGGAGGVSTAGDYARFCQMLLNRGQLNGTRIASPKTIDLMTANHLPAGIGYPPEQVARWNGLGPLPSAGYGFGLGFAVRTEPGMSPLPGTVGDYHWSGAYGTYFWVDPREEMYAVFMVQGPNQPMRQTYRMGLRQMVYQAFV